MVIKRIGDQINDVGFPPLFASFDSHPHSVAMSVEAPTVSSRQYLLAFSGRIGS